MNACAHHTAATQRRSRIARADRALPLRGRRFNPDRLITLILSCLGVTVPLELST